MPEKSQEGSSKSQELIDNFKSFKTEVSLIQWEKASRKVLADSSADVRDAFNNHFKSVTGRPYYIAITDIDTSALQRPVATVGRIDPAGKNYQTERTFHTILWKKYSFTVGKGIERETHSNFELTGLHGEQNKLRVIKTKCKADQIEQRVGKEVADQILKDSRKLSEGTIKGLNVPVMVEGYWEIQFSGKSSNEEKEDVEIQVDGKCLQMMRDVPVIQPGRFIEAADHAHFPLYFKQGDQPRKVIGKRHHFPFTVLREATETEYLQQKAEGDRLAKAAREAEERM